MTVGSLEHGSHLMIYREQGSQSATASSTRSAGLPTIEAAAVTLLRELTSKTGLGHETALKISQGARRMINFGFVRATDICALNLQRKT